MKISLFGDVCPVKNKQIQLDKSFTTTDLALINLENPITSSNNPVLKIGPSLKGSEKTLLYIRKQFPNMFFANLANNHIMDFGTEGVNQTIEACKTAGILYSGVGTGTNLEPLIIQKDDNKIAIISVCEKQFQAAQIEKLGIKTLSPEIYKLILDLKKENHFIIISFHRGSEHFRCPSPKYQELLKSFIDIGADVIYGHHSHIVQGYQEYQHGLIFYGLGNFIVSPEQWPDKNNLWSLTAHINIDNNKIKDYEVIPCEITENNEDTLNLFPITTDYTKKYIYDCNLPLKDKKLLTAIWQEYSVMYYENSLIYLLGHKIGRIILREKYSKTLKHFVKILKREEKTSLVDFLNQYRNLVFYHFFSCESHHEIIETALGIKSGEIEDLRNQISSDLWRKKYS